MASQTNHTYLDEFCVRAKLCTVAYSSTCDSILTITNVVFVVAVALLASVAFPVLVAVVGVAVAEAMDAVRAIFKSTAICTNIT